MKQRPMKAATLTGALTLAAGFAIGVAGCASAPAVTPPAARPVAGSATAVVPDAPLATSLTTTRDAWAIVPMSSDPAFWQVFARPLAAANWKLATPPGVADNGGLVAAANAGSVTVAVRPSEDLTFSPLAVSSDGGGHWATGLLDAGIASTPDALATSGRQLAALLKDGAIVTSADGGATWHTIAQATAIASSPAGKRCGLTGVDAVSFGIKGTLLAGGTCTGAGTGLFAYGGGQWRAVGLPVAGHVVRLAGDIALVVDGTRLAAVWDTAAGWRASAPLAAGEIVAAGTLAGGAAWVLLPGGEAAVTAGSPGTGWWRLPPVPSGTSVLAAGPDGSVDALAVRKSDLDVWRLPGPGSRSGAVWRQVQAISVPIQYGSSS